jgi:hypothetical protein
MDIYVQDRTNQAGDTLGQTRRFKILHHVTLGLYMFTHLLVEHV